VDVKVGTGRKSTFSTYGIVLQMRLPLKVMRQ